MSFFSVDALKGKRLLICEEALIDYKGHFYSWIKAIRTIHQQAGVEVLVAGNKQVNEAIRKEFAVIPAFTNNSWSGMYDYKQAWRRYAAVFAHNYRLLREVKKLLQQTGPVDCILLPASRIYHLLAWRRLCQLYLGKKFKRLVLFVLTSEAIYNEDFTKFHFKRSSLLIKKTLQGFKKDVEAGRVVLAGDSHITCGEYTSLSGVPFRVFPSPGAGLNAIQATTVFAHAGKPAHFVILGVSFFDKGIDLLQTAILRLLEKNPDLPARFTIQWAVPTIDYNGQSVLIDDALRNARQVELIERVLSEDEYQQYLQQADFIVLPYRRQVYFNRISGVAVEAACAGIPMVVTENTWLSWALKEYGVGVTVRNADADDLAEKIAYCIVEKDNLKVAAASRKQLALELNSTIRYFACVWQ